MKYNNPSQYTKEIKVFLDKKLGYEFFIDKEHPLSGKNGKVYYHRHVYSMKVNKWIDKSYHVHHIDGNRNNNDPDNLELLSPKVHWRKNKTHGGYSIKVSTCKRCGNKFKRRTEKYCSNDCYRNSVIDKSKYLSVSKDELHDLVWKIPTTKVAELIGCSDTMVGKICLRLGVNKPPRGYWAKINSSKNTKL